MRRAGRPVPKVANSGWAGIGGSRGRVKKRKSGTGSGAAFLFPDVRSVFGIPEGKLRRKDRETVLGDQALAVLAALGAAAARLSANWRREALRCAVFFLITPPLAALA